MKRDLELPIVDRAAGAERLSAPLLAIALVVIGIVAIYWDTAASIVAIWMRSDTFAHCFAVVPISLWLAWTRRDAIAATPAHPWWPGLIAVALAGAAWLVAATASVLVVKQFAFLFLIEAGIVTVVGLAVARAAAFPLLFLLFAIPAGEALVPMLIDRTADFTVAALRVTGVPVYRDGNQFVISSGTWSVVEACSGIRYLIASMMVGTIFAMLSYRSTGRRIAFFAASIAVPIIANWMRAYLIVMTGHLSGNRLAVGIDHIIYGWIFFGIVMLLLFWVGSLWSEPPALTDQRSHAPENRSASTFAVARSERRRQFAAAAAVLTVAFVWRPLDAAINRTPDLRVPALGAVGGNDGWLSEGKPPIDWRPDFSGASADLAQAFRNGDRVVGLYVAYYRNQAKGRELVTSTNAIVAPENDEWRRRSMEVAALPWNGRETQADWYELSGRGKALRVVKVYWIAGRVTDNDYMAKVLLALSKLTGGGDDSALIVAYVPLKYPDDASSSTLRSFVTAISPGIERALEAARNRK